MAQSQDPWIYKGLELLQTTWDDLDHLVYQTNHLVLFSVNEGGCRPFLEYGFHKTPPWKSPSEHLEFFSFQKKGKEAARLATQHLLHVEGDYLFSLVGFHPFDNDVYIFVNITPWKKNDVMVQERGQPLWLVTSDELIKNQRTYHFPLADPVVSFFSHPTHDSFLRLEDKHTREKRDVPGIAYLARPQKDLLFTTVFGPPRDGEVFTFHEYEEALRKGIHNYKKKGIPWGIVKFALFSDRVDQYHDFVGLSYCRVDDRNVDSMENLCVM